MDVENKVKEIFETILKHKINDGDIVSMKTEELWDSLQHITIIMTLEEEFDILIPRTEIAELNDIQKVITRVKELLK